MDSGNEELIDQKLSKLSEYSALYVEDDNLTREVFIDMISRYFKSLVIATNGIEAMEKFNDLNPDIVITDLEMPFLNGVAFIDKIREVSKEKPILVITSFEDDAHKTPLASSVLIKPVRRDNLKSSLLTLLDILKK